MEYLKFFNLLKQFKLINNIWENVIKLIAKQDKELNDDVLNIFLIYFSLVDDGNICIKLSKEDLYNKWNNKLEGNKILLQENNTYDEALFNLLKEESIKSINSLSKINEDNYSSIIGNNKIFQIKDNYLYLQKYYSAHEELLSSLDRLFSNRFNNPSFNYEDCVIDSFRLKEGQRNVIHEGLNKNLVITGGPGTGKTTSILFLLLGLLINHNYDNIFLLAPSGKAASRMKDSIKSGLDVLSEEFKNEHKDIIDLISGLKRYTIHSLLKIDSSTCSFQYNKNNQLPTNSIYIIDEASMVDVCLFASLLSSLPSDARVFIMGDKNQLPSVDAGAVFGELLEKKSLKENVVKLGEAVRFKIGSPIYELANAINNDDIALPSLNWNDEYLHIIDDNDNIPNPVYYFSNPCKNYLEKDVVSNAILSFAFKYYKDLSLLCTDVDENIDFKALFNKCVKNAEILCAENDGVRGVKTINLSIKRFLINDGNIDNNYPGELIMINQNNKLLDLANGDSGVLIKFKDDNNLYFMIEKDSNIVKEEGKKEGKIFRLDGYLFYPFRFIKKEDYNDAYAITIHKSQGSDYKNILVILPTKKGHPLLNRQIVYTAITRTKGDTYILSNQERLLDAKNTVIERTTNIK